MINRRKVRSEVDERIKEQNNGLSVTDTEYEKGYSNSYLKSVKNREATSRNVKLPGIEQKQSKINENRQLIKNKKTNSKQELDIGDYYGHYRKTSKSICRS